MFFSSGQDLNGLSILHHAASQGNAWAVEATGPAPDLGVEAPWDQKKKGKTGVNPP